MTDSVETLGVDLRTRVKKFGSKKKARKRKCKVRFSIIKKNEAFKKNYMKVCVCVFVKKLLRAGMMPARTWRVHAVGISPTERLKLKRQMAAAAGKKSATSLSFFSWRHVTWKWKMRSLPWPRSFGQKEHGQGNGVTSRKKLG